MKPFYHDKFKILYPKAQNGGSVYPFK
jgi:hypothetical protein